MGGFTASSSPSPSASEDKSDDADKDDGASSSNDDKMTTYVTFPSSFMTKKESRFWV